jgi:hypothetical protein
VPFSVLAEQRIREALARGEFDNLPNSGRPLNLDEYFSAPPDLRMAHSILRNAKCVPVEVELLNEVARLRDAIASASDPVQLQQLRRAFVTRQMQLAITLERRSRRER